MKWKLCALLLVWLVAVGLSAAHADTWVAYDIPPEEADPDWGGEGVPAPSDITFTFENNCLSFNNEFMGTSGGSSHQDWHLLTVGSWAVAGTIGEAETLMADPYATFVYGWHGGHIQWAANTPSGYVAPLLLGYSFDGDGAVSYEGYWTDEITYERFPNGMSATGTLVIQEYTRSTQEYAYTNLSHTFYASYVPEPSSFIALACGLAGLGGLIRRSRRSAQS